MRCNVISIQSWVSRILRIDPLTCLTLSEDGKRESSSGQDVESLLLLQMGLEQWSFDDGDHPNLCRVWVALWMIPPSSNCMVFEYHVNPMSFMSLFESVLIGYQARLKSCQ